MTGRPNPGTGQATLNFPLSEAERRHEMMLPSISIRDGNTRPSKPVMYASWASGHPAIKLSGWTWNFMTPTRVLAQ